MGEALMITEVLAIGFGAQLRKPFSHKVQRRKNAVLTALQIDLITWIANGKKTREISEIKSMNSNTLEAHIVHAMDITGTATRAGLVAYAFRNKIIE